MERDKDIELYLRHLLNVDDEATMDLEIYPGHYLEGRTLGNMKQGEEIFMARYVIKKGTSTSISRETITKKNLDKWVLEHLQEVRDRKLDELL